MGLSIYVSGSQTNENGLFLPLNTGSVRQWLITSQAFNRLHNKNKSGVFIINKREENPHPHLLTLFFFCHFLAAIKEERFRFGNEYDEEDDFLGVAQPVRFNSKHRSLLSLPRL